MTLEEVSVRLSGKVYYEKITDYHIKIGKVNFYPTKEIIHVDGMNLGRIKGFPMLIDVVRKYAPDHLQGVV